MCKVGLRSGDESQNKNVQNMNSGSTFSFNKCLVASNIQLKSFN